MTLQNRVDPFGRLHAVAARGLFTGNRGVLHDPETRRLTGRRWTTRAWIICECAFRGRRRDVMGRNGPSGRAGWTELFFMDEVTALAAGHRPCFFCRRERAVDFIRRFGEACGVASPRAPQLDGLLHRQRLVSGGVPAAVSASEAAGLPDGAMVSLGGAAFALAKGMLLPWSFTGYGSAIAAERLGAMITVLTPAATLAALRAGYRPVWHPSAGQG